MKIFLKLLYISVAIVFYILLGATGTLLIISSFGLTQGVLPLVIGPVLRALICYAMVHNIILKALAKNPSVTKDVKGRTMLEEARKTIKKTIIVIFILDYLLMLFLYLTPTQ